MEQSLMRDPTTAACRIYVGNILESITSPELSTHFSKYGLIRGVLINRGFGFIQFDKEASANSAIQSEHNTIFQGRKIIVRNAVKNPANAGTAAPGQAKPSEVEPVVGQDLNRTARQPPWNNRNSRAEKNNNSNNMNTNAMMENERDRSPLAGSGAIDQDQRWGNMNQNNFNNFGGGGMGHSGNMGGGGNTGGSGNLGPGGGANKGTAGIQNNRFQQQQQQQQQQQHQQQQQQQSHKPHASQPSQRPFGGDRNDCEIIVVNKMLTQYAEAVEARLKRMGLTVDLLFPNDDVPIGKVLANIVTRGCLYAILVLPQNEEHRSITVNILHGQPTEHRNMPVEDALEMIFADFKDRMLHERMSAPLMPKAQEITPTSTYAAPPLNTRHPDAIQTLINLLSDNRPITVLQYDRVIKYLQERREYQLKAEIGDAPPDVPIPAPVDPEAELQRKIMDILNKPSITTIPTVAKASIPLEPLINVRAAASSNSSAASGQPQLLNDPKVQKALDSLFSNSLFKF